MEIYYIYMMIISILLRTPCVRWIIKKSHYATSNLSDKWEIKRKTIIVIFFTQIRFIFHSHGKKKTKKFHRRIFSRVPDPSFSHSHLPLLVTYKLIISRIYIIRSRLLNLQISRPREVSDETRRDDRTVIEYALRRLNRHINISPMHIGKNIYRVCESKSTLQADVEYQRNEYLIITKREILLCERNSCNICATLRCLSLLHHTYIKLRHSSRVFADISILIFSTQSLVCVRKDFFPLFYILVCPQAGKVPIQEADRRFHALTKFTFGTRM